MDNKRPIREKYIQRRSACNQDEIARLSAMLCEGLERFEWFQAAATLYFYYARAHEVDLLPLANKAISMGKTVGFPKTSGTSMDFYQILSFAQFKVGRFQVMEPCGGQRLSEAKPLILVPGVAFDQQKNRMGYGKGYYDRYLRRYPESKTIGIAYNFQIAGQIPTSEYDVKMQKIATESKIW